MDGVVAEAQDRKAMAAKTEQESVLNESLLALFGFNTKAVHDWEAIWGR